MDVLKVAIPLILKALWLSARWAGAARGRALRREAQRHGANAEITFLHDRIAELEIALALTRIHGKKPGVKPRYTMKERLLVIWYMEYFQVSRRQVRKHLGVARSTLYRWLKDLEDQPSAGKEPANKTPREIVDFVWEIVAANPEWGRFRISMQLALLNVFLAASTVRNILQRPEPPRRSSPAKNSSEENTGTPERSISAWYPNHVWSVDRTIVHRWRFWPTYVLVVIDHYSRKLLCVKPLEGGNAGWTIDALEDAFEKYGSPKHIVTDQESIFTGAPFTDLLKRFNVKRRLGAIGQHGSIAVTERVIKTFKYEWLRRVPLIKGYEHLTEISVSFVHWYNEWRPHTTLHGATPDDVFAGREVRDLPRDAKVVPLGIERRTFPEVRMTGFRLKQVA